MRIKTLVAFRKWWRHGVQYVDSVTDLLCFSSKNHSLMWRLASNQVAHLSCFTSMHVCVINVDHQVIMPFSKAGEIWYLVRQEPLASARCRNLVTDAVNADCFNEKTLAVFNTGWLNIVLLCFHCFVLEANFSNGHPFPSNREFQRYPVGYVFKPPSQLKARFRI